MDTKHLHISAETKAGLIKRTYCVHEIVDQDPVVYGWLQTNSGASQGHEHVLPLQPYRSTPEQAWRDCAAYADLNLPSVAEPDWNMSN